MTSRTLTTTSPSTGPTPTAPLLAGTVATPAGWLGLVVTADGVVRAAGFGDLDALLGRLALADPGVDPASDGVRRVGPEGLPTAVTDAVVRYVAGERGALDGVPVRQPGGPFFQAAWAAMRRVPAGRTVTYAELAAMAGNPGAVRAAGSACARNLVAPFVPCHRVVRTDGTLGGYAYGLDAKRRLLAHERGEAQLT